MTHDEVIEFLRKYGERVSIDYKYVPSPSGGKYLEVIELRIFHDEEVADD